MFGGFYVGLFSDIKAIGSIQKIKRGGCANLSVSQITGVLINLTDARRNLRYREFSEIYQLFNELRANKTKKKMNHESYVLQAIEIIKQFDNIAPYEKYSGGDSFETAMFMESIRSEEIEQEFIQDEIAINEEKELYITQMVQQSNGIISLEDAQQFMSVLNVFIESGKEETLNAFKVFSNNIIKKGDALSSLTKIPFFMGILNVNEIITQSELEKMREKFAKEFVENEFSNK